MLHHIGAGVPGTDVESDPAIATTSEGFVAAWRRNRGSAGYLVFARLRWDGTLLEQERAELLDEPRPGVAIASSGRVHAVAYVTAGAIGVQIFRPDGTPAREPVLLPGSAGAVAPALTWMNSVFLAAWTSARDREGTITIAQIDPATGDVRPLSAIQTRSAHATGVLATSSERIALAWHDAPETQQGFGDAGTNNDAALAGTSGTAEPTVLFTTAFEPNGVRLTEPQLQGTSVVSAPSLVWNGHEFAMTWTERLSGQSGSVSRWARLDALGVRRGDVLEVAGSRTAVGVLPSRMAWAGDAYILVRAGSSPTEIVVHRFGPGGCEPR